MGIRLVALDLDGTLLDPQNWITPRTRTAIAAAAGRGVRFAIVTGRMYRSAAAVAREIGIEGTPLVSYNGALVKEFPSGRTVDHVPLPLADARAILAYCEEADLYVQAYWDDTVHVKEINDRTRRYCRNAGVEAVVVGRLLDAMPEAPTKLLIFEPEERIPAIAAELQARFPTLNSAASYPYFLEITHPDANKGHALAALAAHFGLAPEQVLACGDGMNDYTMFEWAGNSAAMAHAPEALKAIATYVVKAPPGDGVAEALETLVLGSI